MATITRPQDDHPHSILPPKMPTETRQLECSLPQPEATLRRVHDPMPFPPTLMETLTHAAAFTDQAAYLAKYATERFAKLDQAYHVLEEESRAELIDLRSLVASERNSVQTLKSALENRTIALENIQKEISDLKSARAKERAVEKEHDGVDHRIIEDLQADLTSAQRGLIASNQREETLKIKVRELEANLKECNANCQTEHQHSVDIERNNSVLKEQVFGLQKDLASAQKALSRMSEDVQALQKESEHKDQTIQGLETSLTATKKERDAKNKALEDLKKSMASVAPHGLQPRSKNNLSAVHHGTNENEIYFFKEHDYIRVDAVRDIWINNSVHPITMWWIALRNLGWDTVDAFFPIPGSNEVYCFREQQYIKYNLSSDIVLEGPSSWAQKWPTLAEAGFTQIDTILPWIYYRPNDGRAAWFFQNDKCMRIDIGTGVVEAGLDNIVSHFPSLAGAGVTSVDIAIFKPGKKAQEAYFFCGERYFLVNLVSGARLYPPSRINEAWDCLRKASFW